MADYFVPGVTPSAAGLLGSLLPTWPEGVARHFVETYTHPDAIVLDPFVVDDIPVREAATAGRRLVATNSNPLVVLSLRERLSPPEPDELKAAVTRLGDSLKRGVPLREHLNQLYRTHCPTCNGQAVADYLSGSAYVIHNTKYTPHLRGVAQAYSCNVNLIIKPLAAINISF